MKSVVSPGPLLSQYLVKGDTMRIGIDEIGWQQQAV
jgi:hypothetical protein